MNHGPIDGPIDDMTEGSSDVSLDGDRGLDEEFQPKTPSRGWRICEFADESNACFRPVITHKLSCVRSLIVVAEGLCTTATVT